MYTKKGMFRDVCYTLEEVGERLRVEPRKPRPLRLASDRLPILAQYVGDEQLILLASYLKLLTDDLWFNVMTDNSARVSVEERDNLMRELGTILKDLSTFMRKEKPRKIYRCYLRLSELWNEVPHLKKEKLETGTPKGDEDALTKETKKAITRSSNILSSGFPSDWHLDIDAILCGAKESNLLINAYVNKINEMQQRGIRVDKLGFIDKEYGPVGTIALMSAIASKIGMDSVLVRLRRRISIGQIKGAKLQKNDFVLIVSDVLTTGDGIIKAAEIVRKYASVNYALVYLDRGQNGRERLRLHGISVESVYTPERLEIKKPNPLPLGGDELFSPATV